MQALSIFLRLLAPVFLAVAALHLARHTGRCDAGHGGHTGDGA